MPIHAAFLNYFVEVYRCGSIREASRKLSISSSAVNRQILKIEDELGTPLFVRANNGLYPTEAGELLYLHVQRTLTDYEFTFTQISNLLNSNKSLVSIAGQESVISSFLPPALLELHSDHPEITTAFKAAGGEQLYELLRLKSVDIALVFDPEPAEDIDIRSSITLPVGVVLTPAHPLANHNALSLFDCSPFPIVLPDQSWPLRQLLDREIKNSEQQLNIITSSNSVEFLKAMMDKELGLGFQTVIGIESQVELGELCHIPISIPKPVTQTFALCIKESSETKIEVEKTLNILIKRLTKYSGWSVNSK